VVKKDDERSQFRREAIVSGENMMSPVATDKDEFDANRLQSLSPAPALRPLPLSFSRRLRSLLSPSLPSLLTVETLTLSVYATTFGLPLTTGHTPRQQMKEEAPVVLATVGEYGNKV
jgi:hypothetical protein